MRLFEVQYLRKGAPVGLVQADYFVFSPFGVGIVEFYVIRPRLQIAEAVAVFHGVDNVRLANDLQVDA